MLVEKVLYRTQVTVTGGRDTQVLSCDGVLDSKLTTPSERRGHGVLANIPYSIRIRFERQKGTNIEELIAAACAGCFATALAFRGVREIRAAGRSVDHLG